MHVIERRHILRSSVAGILRTKMGRLLRWKEERSVAESWRGRPMSGGDWRHDVRRRYHDGAGAHASAIESSHVRSVSALKIMIHGWVR